MPKNFGKVYSDSQEGNWESSVEHAMGFPDGSLTPVFKIFPLGSVHEAIAKEAAKKAGVTYNSILEDGVRWPDVPSGKSDETSYKKLIFPEVLGGDLHRPGTITHASHYGSNQFWHSMTPSGGPYKNSEVLDKVVDQAVQWYDLARKESNIFHVGKILHMVQDSYSDSHTTRTESGAIVTFQSYDKQDPDKHGSADEIRKGETWRDVPGAIPALKASTKILELYKSGASSGELAAYLRKEVYYFANGPIHQSTQDAVAGGSDPKYQQDRVRSTEKKHVHAELDSISGQHDGRYALMARSYAEESAEEAIKRHPELVPIYVRKVLVASEIANMSPECRMNVLMRFDEIAICNIAQANIPPMQIDKEVVQYQDAQSGCT